MKYYLFKNKNIESLKKSTLPWNPKGFRGKEGIVYETNGVFYAVCISGEDIIYSMKNEIQDSNILNFIYEKFGDKKPKIIDSEYKPGTYYRRIRKLYNCSISEPKVSTTEELNSGFVALDIILEKLEEIFKSIEPCKKNLDTYGHRLRELLILTCTEIESNFVSILEGNSYLTKNNKQKKQLSTEDYFKLCKVLNLKKYTLELTQYPSIKCKIKPFKNWNDGTGTSKSILWYNEYNQTKHHRESNLNFGNLKNVIDAVGALVILFYSQFKDSNDLLDPNYYKFQRIKRIFKLMPITHRDKIDKYNFPYIREYTIDNNEVKPDLNLTPVEFPYF